MQLGGKIRQLRKQQKISIEQLAKTCNLSTGLISQMERGINIPSVISLWKVAKALNVPMNYFFDDYKDDLPIIRKSERKKIIIPNSNVTYELLSPNLNKKMELLLIKLEPGKCSSDDLISHEGEECGYMIQGTIKIKYGNKEYILNEGDSIYYDSTVAHRFVNIGEVEAISIWTMTPPSF
ncbi:helix-turn-helix domain-containing protein [Clostridium fermenticellae]|uniref:Helix-turn-helix domain-containing protein n=1 Tax=Clostridium fermenticellae TaxID=2068654 RepID=A0A386H567_9CLOT|nr:XRE family transcriptional regulator [Clostridium fermenticellae]AYD40800.1 helix-turn-helix domain-containing protein [Clostridium fermenticellae]